MTHYITTAPRFRYPAPTAARIAALSEEFLIADDRRRDAIGAEIAGLMDGSILPMKGE